MPCLLIPFNRSHLCGFRNLSLTSLYVNISLYVQKRWEVPTLWYQFHICWRFLSRELVFYIKICSKFTYLNFLIQNLMCFIVKSWFLCWPDAPSILGCENSWLRQRQHSVACCIHFSHKISENKQPQASPNKFNSCFGDL